MDEGSAWTGCKPARSARLMSAGPCCQATTTQSKSRRMAHAEAALCWSSQTETGQPAIKRTASCRCDHVQHSAVTRQSVRLTDDEVAAVTEGAELVQSLV